ncbi:hypothetical protein [Agrobacterium burrii]|uniref:TniQ protein n=1 Tax=Agrobacterium burrii TaxID=2815339 RepID=A0ABS3ECF9_9HYPH|nr:hypothetical protein [Agrobacterium burrii]MBO0129639.1 hypothetical protein [Agrobacterium burrii]
MTARPFTFWRVLPLVGEPANSYFSRLVMDECNHLPGVYASEVGVAPIFKPQELLDRIFLLPISATDKKRLAHWTPIERNGHVHLAGQTFRRNEFRWARKLECRQCIAEVPYQRVWWHLEFFRRCPVHQCHLELIGHGLNSTGRWWPRLDRVVDERMPDVELGDTEDTVESYIIRHLLNPGLLAYDRHLGDFIAAAEFVGRFLNNRKQPSVPPFSNADLSVGYHALKGGTSRIEALLSEWLSINPPSPYAYRIRDVFGWVEEYLLDHEEHLESDFHDAPNPLMLEVSAIIKAECGRLLAR